MWANVISDLRTPVKHELESLNGCFCRCAYADMLVEAAIPQASRGDFQTRAGTSKLLQTGVLAQSYFLHRRSFLDSCNLAGSLRVVGGRSSALGSLRSRVINLRDVIHLIILANPGLSPNHKRDVRFGAALARSLLVMVLHQAVLRSYGMLHEIFCG
jgi:hypothetical protein